MNALILAIIKMLQTLRSMVKTNEAKYTVIPDFTDTFKEVKDLLTEMEALQLVAVEETKATTKATLKLKSDLVTATIAVCRPMKSLASKLKDSVLKSLVSPSPSKLRGMTPSVLVSTCQNIFDKTTELKTQALARGLTEAMYTNMENLLNDYKVQNTDTRKLSGEINTSKKDIDRLANQAMELLADQLDPMVQSLKDSDPAAVELWTSARHVVKPQRTTTELKAKVVTPAEDDSTKQPLPNARFIVSNGKDHTALTNDQGIVDFKPFPFGVVDIKCEMEGFEPFLLKDFKVVRGKLNEVEVTLKRAA